MYILTIDGKEKDGAYSVQDDEGNHVLYLFEEEDDASRYAMLLEEESFPDMHVLEVDPEIIASIIVEIPILSVVEAFSNGVTVFKNV